MDISRIKSKKPWFVPQWLWNATVNSVCDAARENLKVDRVACFMGDASMEGLSKLVSGKDRSTVETVCATVADGGRVLVGAAEAAKDGVVTDEERREVGTALASAVSALVPQERVDEAIERARAALLFW